MQPQEGSPEHLGCDHPSLGLPLESQDRHLGDSRVRCMCTVKCRLQAETC